MLAQNLHGHRALASDHVRIIEGVDKGQALFFLQGQCVVIGIGVTLAVQQHLAPEFAHRIHLELRRGRGHHDHGPAAQTLGAERHALRVVTSGCTYHALFQLRRAQMRHFVVGPAQLETAYRLLVFTLEQHGVVDALAQGFRDL